MFHVVERDLRRFPSVVSLTWLRMILYCIVLAELDIFQTRLDVWVQGSRFGLQGIWIQEFFLLESFMALNPKP